MKNIIADSGYLIDLFAGDAATKEQAEYARKYLKQEGAKLHTLWECVAEASHKLSNKGRQALLKWLYLRQEIEVHASDIAEMNDMAAYMQKYANASRGNGPDVADVALVFLAEKLKAAAVLTVDVNDFQTYRTRKGKPLTIVSWH